MVGRYLLLNFFVGSYLHFVVEDFGKNYTFQTQTYQETSSPCKAPLASAQNWTEASHLRGIEGHQGYFVSPSLCGFKFSSSYHCSNGAVENEASSPMEMWILQKDHKSDSHILWTMWTTLDRCKRWLVSACAQKSKTSSSRGVILHPLAGRRTSMECKVLGKWQMALPIFQDKISNSGCTENDQEQTQEQDQEGTGQGEKPTAVSGAHIARSSLAVSEGIGISTDALACRAPAPHLGDCNEKERIELARRFAGIAPGDAQDAVSGSDKSSPFSSHKAGEGEEGSPGCKDIENELAQCLEELFDGQRGEVEGILPRFREARHRAGSTGPNSLGGCQDSSRRAGGIQAESQGCGGSGQRWQKRCAIGDLGRRYTRSSGHQGPGIERRFEHYAQQSGVASRQGGSCGRRACNQTSAYQGSRWLFCCAIAAFCDARSIDRQEIGYGHSLHGDFAPCVLKWGHAAVKRRRFVSEWQASVDALDEAFALGFAHGSHYVPFVSQEAQHGTCSPKTCSFDETIQIAFGLDDELRMFSTVMPHDSLQQWSDKPWKLRTKHGTARAVRLLADPGHFDGWISEHTAVSDESFDQKPCRSLDDLSFETDHERQILQPLSPALCRCDDDIPAPIFTRNHDEPLDDNRATPWDADPNLLPPWWSQLRSLHDRLGVTECLEEGKVIYVCSWYLHGHNLRRCRQHRVLRLDPAWTTWLDIIKETWQDLLIREQPVEFGLVSPHPPAQVFQGHVAHLILCQDLDHAAAHVGIVSAIYRHTGGDIIVQNAHVLPMTISKEETIDLIPARPQCTIRQCGVQVGDTPAQGDAAIPVLDYTSIVLDIFPLDDDVDDFTSFMAAGTRLRPQSTEPHLMDRPNLARQEEAHDEDVPDTNSTETEEDLAWSHSTVFSVHAPPNEGYVNTVHDTNGPLTRRNVARLAGFSLADLQTVHSMPVPPRDLRERGMRAFLAQHRADLPCGSRLAFVLIDVEFHPQPPSWDVVRARCPIYVPTVLSRHQILRAVDVYLYAQFVQDTCLVWHNDELIHQDQGLYARIYHGDYLRIALPPPLTPMPNVPTRCIARLLQMGVAEHDIEAFYWISDVDNDLHSMPTDFSVIEDVQSSDGPSPRSPGSSSAMNLLQVATTRVSKGKIIEHHRCEDFAALQAQYCAQSEHNQDATAIPGQEQLPWFETELRPLWHAHAVPGPGGMERFVKVLTWYNDHHRYQICAQPREVHLFDDPWEWRALLTSLD